MTGNARDSWVSLEGLRVHYRDWGGAGQPIVLVHGLASSCHIWDLVAPILSRGFAVLALDLRGHGESGKPESGYDFATVASDLHRFNGALGLKKPVIVGHSWGGNVALEYAFSNPSPPGGLCLIDGGTIELSAAPGMTLERAREEMAPPEFTGVPVDRFREMVRSRDFGFEVTPKIEEMIMSYFDVLEDNTVLARFSRASHMKVIDAFWEHKPSALYSHIRCPVLLLPTRNGADQRSDAWRARVIDWLDRAGRLLPVSETVWLEDSVHDVPVQRPELVAGIIEEHVRNGFFDG